MKSLKKIIAVTLALACLMVTPVSATVADYYDIGFLKFNGVYVNRWGQPIPNVVARGVGKGKFTTKVNGKTITVDVTVVD